MKNHHEQVRRLSPSSSPSSWRFVSLGTSTTSPFQLLLPRAINHGITYLFRLLKSWPRIHHSVFVTLDQPNGLGCPNQWTIRRRNSGEEEKDETGRKQGKWWRQKGIISHFPLFLSYKTSLSFSLIQNFSLFLIQNFCANFLLSPSPDTLFTLFCTTIQLFLLNYLP